MLMEKPLESTAWKTDKYDTMTIWNVLVKQTVRKELAKDPFQSADLVLRAFEIQASEVIFLAAFWELGGHLGYAAASMDSFLF